MTVLDPFFPFYPQFGDSNMESTMLGKQQLQTNCEGAGAVGSMTMLIDFTIALAATMATV